MPKFTSILKNRNFFLLWFGQIVSQFGDRLGQMALIGSIPQDAPGSSMQLAKLLSFTILPVFVIGPVAGVYVDRWDRRKTMYISDFLRAVFIMAIPLFLLSRNSLFFIYLLIFLVFSLGRFFVPAKMSVIPEVVKNEELLISNSLVNITGMIAAVLGFAIGGFIVGVFGVRWGFYLDGITFFISALSIFLISTRKRAPLKIAQLSRDIVEVIRKSVMQEVKEGLSYFIKQPQVRFTAMVLFLLGAAGGSVYIVGIVFIRDVLKSVADVGFMIMFLGIGLFLSSLIYGRFGQKVSQYKMIFFSLLLSGGVLVAFVFMLLRFPYFAVAAAMCTLLGTLVAPIITATNTIVHNASDSEMMGKTFSSLEIAMHLGFFLFMFISGFLAGKISSSAVLVIVGLAFVVAGVIGFLYNRKISWSD